MHPALAFTFEAASVSVFSALVPVFLTMESSASTTETDERGSGSIKRHDLSPILGAQQDEYNSGQDNPKDWRISRHELYIILSLTLINMVVALDASVIVTALNVRSQPGSSRRKDLLRSNETVDYCRNRRKHNSRILDWDFVPVSFNCGHAPDG